MHAASRYTTSRLTCNAVPSVFSYSNAPKVVVPRKRPAERVYSLPISKKRKLAMTTPASTGNLAKPDDVISSQEAATTSSARGARRTPLIASTYRSKLSRFHQRLSQKDAALRRQTLKRKKAEAALLCIQKERPALKQFKPRQRAFIGLQMRSIGLNCIAKYTAVEKEDALALYHHSHAAYRHLRHVGHTLPSESTLRGMLSACMSNTRVCPVLLNAVKG